jgi:hypothetical protein
VVRTVALGVACQAGLGCHGHGRKESPLSPMSLYLVSRSKADRLPSYRVWTRRLTQRRWRWRSTCGNPFEKAAQAASPLLAVSLFVISRRPSRKPVNQGRQSTTLLTE